MTQGTGSRLRRLSRFASRGEVCHFHPADLCNFHPPLTHGRGIIKFYHQRGADELVFRALKEFASETLPFHSFDANSAFYHTMLVAFFLYEAFKEDVAAPVVPITSYPTRVRRTLVDFAGKIVRHGGYVILRVTRACRQQLKLDEIWRRSGDPPRFVWST